MTTTDQIIFGWLALTSVIAFLMFGYDKYQATRTGSRVSEFNLALVGALGGWLGGIVGMFLFRHKTAKLTFKLKFAVAGVVWAGWLYAVLYWRRHGGF